MEYRSKLLMLLSVVSLSVVVMGVPNCQSVAWKIDRIQQELTNLNQIGTQYCTDYGVEKAFPNHRRDTPKHPHRLHIHTVCRDPLRNSRKLFVQAQLHPEDLGAGSVVSEAERKRLKPSFTVCSSDHAGHIVAREFGGPGEEFNLFAQNANLNMGAWARVNNRIGAHLQKTQEEIWTKLKGQKTVSFVDFKNRHADIEIGFRYSVNSNMLRPDSFVYKINLRVAGDLEKEIYGEFENVDHTYAEVDLCIGDGLKELYEVTTSDERHDALKTCDVAVRYKYLFN